MTAVSDAVYIKSIRNRISLSFTMLMLIIAIPFFSSLFYLTRISAQYDGIVESISISSRLSKSVEDVLPSEIWNLVAGHTAVEDSSHNHTLTQLESGLDAILNDKTGSNAYTYAEAANKATRSLRQNISLLEQEIRARRPVSDYEVTQTNILEICDLIDKMLIEYVHAQSDEIMDMHLRIRETTGTIVRLMALLLFFSAGVAACASASLNRSIHISIEKLQAFAHEIASGNLNARTGESGTLELVPLARSLNQMAIRIKELLEENIRKQKDIRRQEMRALQAQITPHFLYNTFDTIIWLAEDGQNDEVVEVTGAFSDYCRISLSKGHDFITVEQEVSHIRSYFVIQSYRYSDILRYEVNADPAVLKYRCLKLLLQPLVENAIYHGIKNTRFGGKISVSIRAEQNRIRFSVADTGQGMDEAELKALQEVVASEDAARSGTGYGLYNVSRRLRLYYGYCDMNIHSKLGVGTELTFTIPKEEDVET